MSVHNTREAKKDREGLGVECLQILRENERKKQEEAKQKAKHLEEKLEGKMKGRTTM